MKLEKGRVNILHRGTRLLLCLHHACNQFSERYERFRVRNCRKMINELRCEVAESPYVNWRAMALISLDFRRELSNRNIEHLSDLLTVFLKAESQVKVDQL